MPYMKADMSMQVPRFLGQGKIDFVERPVPEPGPAQLLLQVKANALCGSERPQFLSGSEVTPGHEAAGIVVAAGPDTHTALGTPGVVFLMDFCGACRSCRLGLTNQCLNKRGDMGFNKDGGYAPYELIHESIFFSVGDDLPLVEATMLLDVMGTSAHAIKRARLVHPDIQSVVVTGAGPVGLGVLAMAKLIWGDDMPVLVSDIVPYRLQLAERLGGKPIDLREQTLEQGVHRHGLQAVDLGIDTSGKSAARQACLAVLDRRGVLVCVGHGETLTLQVSPDLIAAERAVLGSEYFCYDELGENLQRLAAHGSYLGQIITHRYPVRDIQHAFETFFAGETGKVVVEQ
jgi:threonine dehydrogenase-like Zn-dependent dehydrogenase